jgi:hypothetical protein
MRTETSFAGNPKSNEQNEEKDTKILRDYPLKNCIEERQKTKKGEPGYNISIY